MSAVYKVTYYSPSGQKLIESLPISEFDLARRLNTIGALKLKTARVNYPLDYFKRDGRLEIWRSVNGRPFYREGETQWFILKKRYATNSDGERVIELSGYDNLHLLKRRTVPYEKGTTYTEKLGLADDTSKDVIRENFGSSSIDTARDISAYLSVQANAGLGAIVGDSIGDKNVYDVLRRFSQASKEAGVPIYFDVVSTGSNSFEFRTYKDYRGDDHSADSAKPVIVAQEFGNLSEPERIDDWTESYNYVYAAGKGEDEWRPVAEASDSEEINLSPFARTEFFENASNVDDPAKLARVANAVLEDGAPRVRFSGRVLDTRATVYGIHYKYGDLLTAKYEGAALDCSVATLHITYSRDRGELLDIRLDGEF